MYDLSIELPTETIENFFCDRDDDHAAIPTTAEHFVNKARREKRRKEIEQWRKENGYVNGVYHS